MIDKDKFARGIYIANQPIQHSVVFHFDQDPPILKIDKDGFHFKGETIEDAGKAYDAFMKVMGMMKK